MLAHLLLITSVAKLGLTIEIHSVPSISFQIGDQISNHQQQSIGNWITAGEAHFSNQKLSLVQGTDEDSFGKAFYNKMIDSKYFSIDLVLDLSDFKSSQSSQAVRYKTFEPRRGFAFWYLTDPLALSRINEFGEYYGQMNDYKGIGIFFYNRKMGEIIIHVQENNGQPTLLETPSQSSNFCLIRLPHKEKSQITIEFTPNELKVSAIVIGNRPRVCISNPNFTIKQPGFIGLSASNLGISAQDISLTHFQFINNDTNFNHSAHPKSDVQPDTAKLNSIVQKSNFSSTKQSIIAEAKTKFLINQTAAAAAAAAAATHDAQQPPVEETPPPQQIQNQQKQKAANKQAIDKALHQHQKQFQQLRSQERKVAQENVRMQNERKARERIDQSQSNNRQNQANNPQIQGQTINPSHQKDKATNSHQYGQFKNTHQQIQTYYKERLLIGQQTLKKMDQPILQQIKDLQEKQQALVKQFQSTKDMLYKNYNSLQSKKTETKQIRQEMIKKIEKFTGIIRSLKDDISYLKNIRGQMENTNKQTSRQAKELLQKNNKIFGMSKFWAFILFILVIVRDLKQQFTYNQIFLAVFYQKCISSTGSRVKKYHLP